MRVAWITAAAMFAGCGFRLTISSDAGGEPVDDAAFDTDPGTVDGDAPLDESPTIDAPWSVNDCPTSYVAVGTQPTRYRVIATGNSVRVQHNACAADNAHLAVIDNASERTALRQFIDGTSGLPTIGGVGTLVYIGSAQRPNQTMLTAGWLSATGTFNGSFWEDNEPNDGGGNENGEEQFAAIWRQHDLIADVPNISLPALCECDGLATTMEFETLVTGTDAR